MLNVKNLVWLLLSVLIVIIDYFTKQLIVSNIALNQGVVINNFLNIVHVHNYGAAFSFLNIAGGLQRWFFSSISIIAVVLLTIWLCYLPQQKKCFAAALALIIGGAVGNFIGRAFYGYVIDFLDFHLGNYHWPAFNVADSAVTIGAIILIWQLFISERST